MTGLDSLHWIASVAAERLLYSVGEGTALALTVWVLLRLVPRRNSQTRFTAWFVTLLAIAVLPLLSAPWLQSWRPKAINPASGHAMITVSSSWAVYIFLGWVLFAFVGLARVAVAVWQLRKLRASCVPIDARIFGAEEGSILAECQRVRPSLVMVSHDVDVPTAVGFRNPVIILPAWLVEETGPTELKYIVLHELAHLRRRDDWTNLAQKVVKALLFFHPGVWWIERRLSLDREMACDDAVLAQSASPKGYAQCLARVAEKSFLRRQIALAQAAVSRMRQLSLRVTQILDVQRPGTTHLWKPAIPLVVTVAVLCAFSATYLPSLVSFTADAPIAAAQTARASHGSDANHPTTTTNAQFGVRSWNAALNAAALKSGSRGPSEIDPPALIGPRSLAAHPRTSGHTVLSSRRKPTPKAAGPFEAIAGAYQYPEMSEPRVIQEEVLMVFTSVQSTSAGQGSWQMQVWQLRVVAPTPPVQKVIPRKT